MMVWAEHSSATKSKVTCPLCREEWPKYSLTELKLQHRRNQVELRAYVFVLLKHLPVIMKTDDKICRPVVGENAKRREEECLKRKRAQERSRNRALKLCESSETFLVAGEGQSSN